MWDWELQSNEQMCVCVCACTYIYICIQTQYISTVWSDIVCERMKTNHSSLDTANDREGAGSHRNNVLQPKLQMLAGQCPRLHHRKPGRCAFCSIMFHPILVVLMISDDFWWFCAIYNMSDMSDMSSISHVTMLKVRNRPFPVWLLWPFHAIEDWDLALNAVEDCIANTSHTLDTEQKIRPEGVPERADLGETLEDIMESSLLSRTAWTKLFDEDGGRSVLEILLRQLDDEQQDWTTELIESTTHQLLQVGIAFLAGAFSMCVIGTVGTVARPETKIWRSLKIQGKNARKCVF